MGKRKAKSKKKPKAAKPSFAAIRKMLLLKRDGILEEMTHVREPKAPARRPDPADMASETADGDVEHQIYQSGSAELAQIDRALKKIEERTYGLCEVCAEPIPIARVRALPFATTCVRCKERQELVERARQSGSGLWPAAGDVGPGDEAQER